MKSKRTRNDFVKYFGQEQLDLNAEAIQGCLKCLQDCFHAWEKLIQKSFLSDGMKQSYLDILLERRKRLKL